jgi:cell fate regulator YaaT (PSP1 superfamily)
MNAYDWLQNLPISDMESSCRVIEVSFNNGSRKDFFRNNNLQHFEKGDMISVEGVSGFDLGEVSLTGEIVRLQLKKKNIKEDHPDIKKVLRPSTERDIELWKITKAKEKDVLIRSRAIVHQLKLNMKISEVELQADGRKGTFFYIADGRVDFRELIKIYASEFKVKVEMRQIGARQESAKVGGIGSCGRELCCSTWLTEFKSVNTAAARYQNLSINQAKLSGQCGRLKCCLNYELDTYLDALQFFPDNADQLRVAKGNAYLIKKDIFKKLMWYTLPDSNKHYPVTIERVKKIKELNAKNIIPDDLEAVEIVSSKPKEIEPEYADLVGQISLKSLEKSDRKRSNKTQRSNRPQNPNRPPDQRDNRPPDQRGNRPQRPSRPQNQSSNNPKPDNQGPQNQNRPERPANPNRSGQQQRNRPNPNRQNQGPRKPPTGEGSDNK